MQKFCPMCPLSFTPRVASMGIPPPVSAPLLGPDRYPPGYPLYPLGYIVSVLTISVLTAVVLVRAAPSWWPWPGPGPMRLELDRSPSWSSQQRVSAGSAASCDADQDDTVTLALRQPRVTLACVVNVVNVVMATRVHPGSFSDCNNDNGVRRCHVVNVVMATPLQPST